MPALRQTRRTARRNPLRPPAFPRSGLTLIEMLMATVITLMMMAAIVTLFGNLSSSITNRRALIEISGQLRQARQLLARDLAGCTVPSGPQGLTPWRQRPGEAIGYFEIQEGRPGTGVNYTDAAPSRLVDGIGPNNGDPEIDYAGSLVPSGGDPQSLLPQQVLNNRTVRANDVTNGGALGDYDDVMALTVRSIGEPFVALLQVPIDTDNDGVFDSFVNQRVESSLAEVIWYATENQPDDPNTTNFDESIVVEDDPATSQDETIRGEPGMRTIYRRVRLIAPWLPTTPAVAGPPPYDGKISIHQELLDPTDLTTAVFIPNTLADLWDPLESTCRHASLSIL